MRGKAAVYYNEILAGYLSAFDEGYVFCYDKDYLADTRLPAISLSFPRTAEEFHSKTLFPFFFGLLAEGDQKQIQCRILGIDEENHFTRLVKTAENTIGAISIKEVEDE
ncbi:MAG: HipA N-terminal domain-containing protein [Syntrophothermus sp.]